MKIKMLILKNKSVNFYIVINLLMIFSLISCNKKTDYLIMDLGNIDGNNFKKAFLINDIAKNVNYIPLEEDSICLLTGIEKLEASADYLFVLDREQLFQFNKTGKFIRQIGRLGKGPNEFSCYDFDIDLQKETIYVLDYFQEKIVKYSFNGVFIETYRNPVSINSIEPTYGISYLRCLGNGKIILASNSNTQMPETHLFDEKERSLGYIQRSETTSSVAGSIILPENKIYYFYDGQLYGKHMFSDTIYHYSEDGKVAPKYLIRAGKLSLKINNLNSIEKFPPKQSVMIMNIIENSYFIMIFYKYFINKNNYKLYLSYYDKYNPYPYDSFCPILYFEEVDQEFFNKSAFDNHGTFKKKDSRIDGASKLFLTKDNNLYQIRTPQDLPEKRTKELQIEDFTNPCIIQYTLNEFFLGNKKKQF